VIYKPANQQDSFFFSYVLAPLADPYVAVLAQFWHNLLHNPRKMASNLFPKISEQRGLPIEIEPIDVILTEGEDNNDIISPTDSSSGSASSRPSPASPSGAKGKGVSFAPILVAPNDNSRDTPQDLLSTNVSALREELSQVHIDLSAEKAIRKKKDKSLFKLAKQLAVQTEEISHMEKYIREVRDLLLSVHGY
jgi:hypothetical protein